MVIGKPLTRRAGEASSNSGGYREPDGAGAGTPLGPLSGGLSLPGIQSTASGESASWSGSFSGADRVRLVHREDPKPSSRGRASWARS